MVLKRNVVFIVVITLLFGVFSAEAQSLRGVDQPHDSKKVKELLTNDVAQYELKNLKIVVDWLDLGAKHQKRLQIVAAKKCYENYIMLLKRHLNLMLGMNSLRYQEEYWNVHLKNIRHIQYSAILLHEGNIEWGDLLYDCALLSKYLLQDSALRLNFSARYSGDSAIVNLWKMYQELRYRYSRNMTSIKILETDSVYIADRIAVGIGHNQANAAKVREVDIIKQTLDSTRNEMAEIEQVVSRQSSTFLQPLTALTVSWKEVRNSLASGQAAIEFTTGFSLLERPRKIYYAATLLRPNSERPCVIPLFEEEELKRLLENQHLNAESLYDLIWKKIDVHLNDVREVYLSSAGLLNLISFSALKQGQSYLSDRYAIRNVQSTREITEPDWAARDTLTNDGEAVFFGGIDFGASLQKTASRNNANRGQGVDYLAQSKKEVTRSARLLAKKGWRTALFTEEKASEEQLKKMFSTQTPSLLHISSHGFYLNGHLAVIPAGKMREVGISDRPLFSYDDNPLMRSGLLLAGANWTWSGKKRVDWETDGILTGQEITCLNMANTRLVVLPACYTAIGDIDYYEGVYGLQKAFRMAGAGQMIMALWDIPDKESAEFMELFYELLAKQHLIGQAFRGAQKRMRERYPNESRKWAGFMLVE